MNLGGGFGMCEMEWAAEQIIEMCQKNGTWYTQVRYEDIEKSKAGFLHLLMNGFLQNVRILSKTIFFVNKDFIERVNETLKRNGEQEIVLKGSGEFQELLEDIYPFLKEKKSG